MLEDKRMLKEAIDHLDLKEIDLLANNDPLKKEEKVKAN